MTIGKVEDKILIYIGYRVPMKNDLYINKNEMIQRCKDNNYSRNAQKRTIVKEKWLVWRKR